jgi:hypothetical protein
MVRNIDQGNNVSFSKIVSCLLLLCTISLLGGQRDLSRTVVLGYLFPTPMNIDHVRFSIINPFAMAPNLTLDQITKRLLALGTEYKTIVTDSTGVICNHLIFYQQLIDYMRAFGRNPFAEQKLKMQIGKYFSFPDFETIQKIAQKTDAELRSIAGKLFPFYKDRITITGGTPWGIVDIRVNTPEKLYRLLVSWRERVPEGFDKEELEIIEIFSALEYQIWFTALLQYESMDDEDRILLEEFEKIAYEKKNAAMLHILCEVLIWQGTDPGDYGNVQPLLVETIRDLQKLDEKRADLVFRSLALHPAYWNVQTIKSKIEGGLFGYFRK